MQTINAVNVQHKAIHLIVKDQQKQYTLCHYIISCSVPESICDIISNLSCTKSLTEMTQHLHVFLIDIFNATVFQ